MKALLYILAFVIGTSAASAQILNRDSLRHAIAQQHNDPALCKTIYHIASTYTPSDSVVYYANLAAELAEKNNHIETLILTNRLLAVEYYYQGKFSLAKEHIESMLKYALEFGDPVYKAHAFATAAIADANSTDFEKKLGYLDSALVIYKTQHLAGRAAAIFRYLGKMFGQIKMFETANGLFYQSIKTAGDCQDIFEEARTYNSLATYTMLEMETAQSKAEVVKKTKNAISKLFYYIDILAGDTADIENRANVAKAYCNIAHGYIILAKVQDNNALIDSAQKYVDKIEQFGYNRGIVYTNTTFLKIAIAINKGNHQAAQLMLKELETQKDITLTHIEQAILYNYMSATLQRIGKTREAIEYKNKARQYQLSVVNERNIAIGSDMQAKLLAQNKISQIERQTQLITLANNEKLHNVKVISYAIFAILAVIILVSIVLASILGKNKIATRKLNILYLKHEEHNKKLIEQQEEIARQNTLIKQQRDDVDKKNKEIMSSIAYAKRILKAAFSQEIDLESAFNDAFLLKMSTSSVPCSFHIIHKTAIYQIFAAATCTTTGVAGSFLTMLGIATLKEVLMQYHKNDKIETQDILNKMEAKLRQIINKTSVEKSNDTIEMSLIAINTQTHELSYSGAAQPIYIYTNGSIKYIAGNPAQLCSIDNNTPYTQTTCTVNDGDMVYIATNSLAAQIGGPQNQPFGKQQLEEMLANIAQKPCNEQKQLIYNTVSQWMKGYNQMGDISVVGTRISF